MQQNDIEAIEQLTRSKNTFRIVALLFIPFTPLLFVEPYQWGFIPATLMIISLLACIGIFFKRIAIRRVASYAIVNSFEEYVSLGGYIQPDPQPDSVMSHIGDYRYYNVIGKGVQSGYPVRLMSMYVTFDTASWTGLTSTKKYLILEITTQQNFWHVFLDSKSNNGTFTPSAMRLLSLLLKQNQKITVEGDVEKYFDIYAAEGKKSENLITLTPDKLIALRDYGKNFDVEFVGNSIYLITGKTISNTEDLLRYGNNMIKLLGSIGQNLVRNQNTPSKVLTISRPTVLFKSKTLSKLLAFLVKHSR
jgi:hypothetical protein